MYVIMIYIYIYIFYLNIVRVDAYTKNTHTSMHINIDVIDYRTIHSLIVSVSQIWASGQQ